MLSEKHWDVALVSLHFKRNISAFFSCRHDDPPSAILFFVHLFSNIRVTIEETPRCSEYPGCSPCAEDEDCAWCASADSCMTVSEIFSIDCRGTVFDLPCPDSFVAGEIQVVSRLRDCRLLASSHTLCLLLVLRPPLPICLMCERKRSGSTRSPSLSTSFQ